MVRINHGIDLSRFDPHRTKPAIARRGLRDDGHLVVGRVSRLVPEKDVESFIRAAAEVATF